MKASTCENYLVDLATILLDKLDQLEKEMTSSSEGNDDYTRGLIMAYYDSLSIVKSQAELFNLSIENLNNVDLERYLTL